MDRQQLEQILSTDPGNSLFADYAELLREDGMGDRAFTVCFAGLSHNPSCHKGRLVLARLYYEGGYIPFAIRELEELYRALDDGSGNNQFIVKLLKRLGKEVPASVASSLSQATSSDKMHSSAPGGSDMTGPPNDETVAEVDFDVDEIDLIEGSKKN